LTALIIGGSSFAGWKAFETRREIEAYDQAMNESIETRSVLILMQDLAYHDDTFRRLQQEKERIKEADRKRAFTQAVTSYAARNPAELRRSIRRALKVEAEYFNRNRGKREEIEARFEKLMLLSLGVLSIGLIIVVFTIHSLIFRALNRLSRRMLDFLVDRYSFQFSQPDQTELGDLQRTFNSLAQKVINTTDELKRLDQAKSEFLSIASHELRTPMTSIKGSLALLASGVVGQLDIGSLRLIKIAEGETDRLIRLINDLLDLAKIESGGLPLNLEWVQWDEFCSKTLEGLAGLAHKTDVRLEQASLPTVEVSIDRDRLQQVLTNLVSNAIKFSPRGTAVRVTLSRAKTGELVVSVTDSGPGIKPEDRELIFEKFRQGATVSNPLVKGTGLGLAIAKALVAEHGGSIGVESTMGVGSTFWFSLPQWRENEQAKAA
ncbi:MAG: HAMP domain-containing sensor histidine kinase, partial [Bdellovibrionales bacterium]|nr:HAMP domain-containing sensor histidine kinase [Bdellovibrionales bacterium]